MIHVTEALSPMMSSPALWPHPMNTDVPQHTQTCLYSLNQQ